MGLFAHQNSSSKGASFMVMDLESRYGRSKSPDKSRRSKTSHDLSNSSIDLLTSKVTGYRNSKHCDASLGPRSCKTQKASGSRRESRSTSVSRNRSKSPSLSQRQARSTTPRSMGTTVIASGSQRKGRSLTPKSMRTTIIASGSQRNSRSSIPNTILTSSPTASRSRSAEPSMRKSRSIDVGVEKSRSRSVDSDQKIRKSKSSDVSATKSKSKLNRSRSADPIRIKTTESVKDKISRFTRSLSPSNANAKSTSKSVKLSKSSKSSSGNSETPSKSSSKTTTSTSTLIKCIPFGLEKDMTYLADGMKLDKNMRYFLAVFDANNLEDFYLMSDSDFFALVQKAKASNRCIPPLQLRKVQMLRRWIKEVVEDHVLETEDENGTCRRKRKVQLIPKDWKEQYRNDLPHLKLQLRQQSESIYEKIRNISETLGCGASMLY